MRSNVVIVLFKINLLFFNHGPFSFCLRLLNKAAVPCRWCAGVAFCGPRCRDLALATYHRWECKFFNLLRGSGMSLNCYLALRIITQHGLHFFKKVRLIKLSCILKGT